MSSAPKITGNCPYPDSPSYGNRGLGRFVDVGWVLDTDFAKFIWNAPQRVRRQRSQSVHAKSLARCPAVHDSDGRLFEISCPFDIHIELYRNSEGTLLLKNLAGPQSPIRSKHLSNCVKLINQTEWAHPGRPVIQIITPYVLVADEPVYANQLPAFGYYRPDPLPGLMVAGRFPADIWPRHLMWAFEWHALDRPLKLTRGEPWWYIRFDHIDPSRSVRMVPAEMTSELREYMKGIEGVTNYVDQTYDLFKIARARRPESLLTRKTGHPGNEATEIDEAAQISAAAEENIRKLQDELYRSN